MHYLSILTFILFFTSISYAQDLFNYSVEEFKADTENQMLSFSMLDDSLYAVSDLSRAHIEIINKNTGVTVRKIGKRGRGPGEIGRINFFTYDKVNQVFTVFDSGGFSIKRFNLNGEVIDEKLLPKVQVFMPYYGHQIDEDNLYIFAYNYTNENILHQYSISKNEYVKSYIKFNEITSNIDDEVYHQLYKGLFLMMNFIFDSEIILTPRLLTNKLQFINIKNNRIRESEIHSILDIPNLTKINPKNLEDYVLISSRNNKFAFKSFEHVIGLGKLKDKLLCFIQLDSNSKNVNNFGFHLFNYSDEIDYEGFKPINAIEVDNNRNSFGRSPQYFLMHSNDNEFYFRKAHDKYTSIVKISIDNG